MNSVIWYSGRSMVSCLDDAVLFAYFYKTINGECLNGVSLVPRYCRGFEHTVNYSLLDRFASCLKQRRQRLVAQ